MNCLLVGKGSTEVMRPLVCAVPLKTPSWLKITFRVTRPSLICQPDNRGHFKPIITTFCVLVFDQCPTSYPQEATWSIVQLETKWPSVHPACISGPLSSLKQSGLPAPTKSRECYTPWSTGAYQELGVLYAQWEGWNHTAELHPLHGICLWGIIMTVCVVCGPV